jgi:lipopolysaccharide export system protein LptA
VKGLKSLLRSLQILVLCAAAVPIALFCADTLVRGESDLRSRAEREPISISATFAQTWQQDRETVQLLRGQCQIVQGSTTIRAERMVIWRRAASPQSPARERVTAYLEEDVRIDEPGNTLTERTLVLDLVTAAGVTVDAQRPITGQSATHDPTYKRALARRGSARRATVQQAQYPPAESDAEPEIRNVQLKPPSGGIRRLRWFPRGGGSYFIDTRRSENTTPPEQIVTISGGVNLLIDGPEQQPGAPSALGTIDLSADRVVIWTDATTMDNLAVGVEQPQELPLQIYLEGNIVVRQGRNVLLASQAFYDVREERALLLNSEIRARIPGFPTKVRVRTQQLRQTGHDTFHAQDAFITASEFAKPGFRLQASDIFIEPRFDDPWISVQGPQFDPDTGEPMGESTLWATTLNNTFFIEDVPVFYFPYLSAPAEDPNIPLRNLQFHSDRIFGQAVYTTWDLFKLTGIDRVPGTRWDLNVKFYISNALAPAKLKAFPAGSTFVVPANISHFHWMRSGEAVAQITGIGPNGFDYVDHADDPRKK